MFQLKSIENTLLLLNDKNIKETPIDMTVNPSTSTEKLEDTTVKPPMTSTRMKSKRKRKSNGSKEIRRCYYESIRKTFTDHHQGSHKNSLFRVYAEFGGAR